MSTLEIETMEDEADLVPAELVIDELTLQRVRAEDAAEAYAIHDANRAHLATQLDFAAGYTSEKAKQAYAEAEEKMRNGTLASYWIVRDGQKVGAVSLSFADDTKAELGYWLIESAQGSGIATRAAQRMLEYGFQQRGLRSIELHIKPNNEASKQIAARLGAHVTGQQEEVWGGITNLYDIWEVSPS